MKKVQLILAFCAIAMISFANDPGEITVKSTIVCDMCKDTIEEGLAYEKGIKRVLVDVDEKTIFVKFNEKKLSEQEVKVLITELGYAADDMKPVKEAYDNLHGCCKMEGACEGK